jgi:4-amino-4-deoxy-L-arabinose transferase-like glycosyltransferase
LSSSQRHRILRFIALGKQRFSRDPLLVELGMVCLAAAILLARLGEDALRDWDESIYASVARTMARTSGWLDPQYAGAYFPHKPPLLYWLMALSMRLLGESEFAARLPSALFGVAGVWVVMRLARAARDASAGALAGAILLSSTVWVRFTRQAMLDSPLATTFAFGLLALRAESAPGLGIALGAAALIKGPAVALALPPLVVHAVARGPRGRRTVLRGCLLGAAIALPWHLQQMVAHGSEFTSYYFGFNVVARAAGAVEGHGRPASYYLNWLFTHYVNPWQAFGAIAVVVSSWRWVRGRAGEVERLAVVSFWSVLLVCMAARTKLPWYVLPAFLPLAVLTAGVASDLVARNRFRRTVVAAVTTATVLQSAAVVLFDSLRDPAAEDTRAVLRALPPAPTAPVLRLAEGVPPGTARFYAARPVWPMMAGAPGEAGWLLAPHAASPPGFVRVTVHGTRALFAPRGTRRTTRRAVNTTRALVSAPRTSSVPRRGPP